MRTVVETIDNNGSVGLVDDTKDLRACGRTAVNC